MNDRIHFSAFFTGHLPFAREIAWGERKSVIMKTRIRLISTLSDACGDGRQFTVLKPNNAFHSF